MAEFPPPPLFAPLPYHLSPISCLNRPSLPPSTPPLPGESLNLLNLRGQNVPTRHTNKRPVPLLLGDKAAQWLPLGAQKSDTMTGCEGHFILTPAEINLL